MLLVLLLLTMGLLLSAFFSGSETGFYRASRLRFALDGMSGDPVSRGLLWLVNNPTLFVATTLIGNNVANYLVSLGIVLGTQRLLGTPNPAVELAMPIVLAPIIFIYGELLPKHLYYLAPNQLLRWGGPFFMLCGVLFAPFSFALWFLGRLLKRFVGESPELVRLQLARQELRKLLDEGHEAGILKPQQRQLAQGVFEFGDRKLEDFAVPVHRVSTVTTRDSRAHLLRLARRQHASDLLVVDARTRVPRGYVRLIDLLLTDDNWQKAIRVLPSFATHTTFTSAMMRLQNERATMGQLLDPQQKVVGAVLRERLLRSLYMDG